MVGSAWDTQQMVSLAQVGSAIDVRPVFVKARAALLNLLPELSSQEWTAPTVCPGWAVKDIAVHLLHDDLRRLSRTRDGYSGGPAPATGQSPVEFLNSANQRWVTETGFLSPGLLVDLLAHTSPLVEAMWAGADLHAPSEGVWWAGIDLAPAWAGHRPRLHRGLDASAADPRRRWQTWPDRSAVPGPADRHLPARLAQHVPPRAGGTG